MLGKIDRAEQHPVRPHQYVDVATAQRRLPLRRQRRLGPTMQQMK
jgi:hypothetical protein